MITKPWHITAALACLFLLVAGFLWSTGAHNSPVLLVSIGLMLMVVAWIVRRLE